MFLYLSFSLQSEESTSESLFVMAVKCCWLPELSISPSSFSSTSVSFQSSLWSSLLLWWSYVDFYWSHSSPLLSSFSCLSGISTCTSTKKPPLYFRMSSLCDSFQSMFLWLLMLVFASSSSSLTASSTTTKKSISKSGSIIMFNQPLLLSMVFTIALVSTVSTSADALKRRSPLHSDVIEEVEAKRLQKLIQEQDYIAVFFCE